MTLALYGKSKTRQSILLVAALIALIGSMSAALFVLTKAEAAPPNPSLGSATVDGSSAEWNLATDFFANMYRAADPTKELESKLYLRYQCSTNTLFVLVLAESGIPILAEADNTFVKLGNSTTLVNGNSGDNGTPPDFAWIGLSAGQATGFEASAVLAEGVYDDLNVHVNVFDDGKSQTSAVIDRAIDLTIDCPDPAPQLTVIKQVQDHTGADISDAQNFAFAVSPTTGVTPSAFNLDDDADVTLSNTQAVTLPATTDATDSYTITETPVEGYSLFSATCTGGTATAAATNGVSVTVNNTSVATCTFINRKAAPQVVERPLRVIKVVTGTHPGGTFGGTITPGGTGAANQAFSLVLPANTLTSPADANVVSVAAHTVTEATLPLNWANSGYYVVADSDQNYVCSGTETYTNVAGSATVPAGTDGYTVCVKNTFTPPPVGTPAASKSDTGDGTYNLGESFVWNLSWNVTGGTTNQAFNYVDVLPAQIEFDTTPLGTEVDPGSRLSCTTGSGTVNCTLASGAIVGVYTQPVNVKVKTAAACGPVTNNMTSDTAQGPIVASDTVQVAGCGTVEIDKSDSTEIVGDEVIWTITLNNSSAVVANVIVYDANTDLVATGTVGCVDNTTNDYYDCAVPANGQATLKVSQAIPAYNVCAGTQGSNTAYIAASNTAGSSGALDQDSGGFTIAAVADPSCITVEKELVSEGIWNITFTNDGPTATVNFSDTYEDGPTDTDIISVMNGAVPVICGSTTADTRQGCVISVANGETVITVNTGQIAGTCEEQTVSNTVAAFFGQGTPQGVTLGTTEGGSLTDTYVEPSDSAECQRVIQICKVWEFDAPGELSDGMRDFTISVNDGDGAVAVTLEDVVEGDETPVCQLLSVDTGSVIITENPIPAGFNTPDLEVNDEGRSENDASVTIEVPGNQCPDLQVSLVERFSLLVADILPLVVEVEDGTPLCTVTFFNTDTENTLPSGNLRVEKYLDINGDGDADDAGEGPIQGWEMTVSGADVNGSFDTNASGVVDFAGLETGDVYNVSEEVRAGYTVTNTTVGINTHVSQGAVTATSATIPEGETVIVRFYNQPLREIRVVKVAYTRHNNGADVLAPTDDDGWIITVSSAQCQFSDSEPTDANGIAVFTNLPLCNDYVVSENPVNAGSPGFTPGGPVQHNNLTPGVIGDPLVVTFVNRLQTFNPPCINCNQVVVTPTPTPVTPTATPTGPTATPTNTPVPGTATNTPVPATTTQVTIVEGERTPGPGQTPIAPSAGAGFGGSTGGGMNLLLIAAGLLAFAMGFSAVALGSRRK